MSNQFDVVIVGGALVGMSLACALSSLPLSIAIVEPKPFPKEKPNINRDRAIALNYSSQQFLDRLGLWADLSEYSQAINQVHVSEKGAFSAVRLRADEMNLPFLGQLIPEAALSHVLLTQTKSQDNITWLREDKVTALEKNTEGYSVVLESRTIKAGLLIAADGANSMVRDLLGIEAVRKQADFSAMVARVNISEDHHQTAYERFTSKGTIAFLPVSEKRGALIISGHNELIDDWSDLDEHAFLVRVQDLFGYRLGAFLSVDQRQRFPLEALSVEQPAIEYALLMGHAAHVMHPVAAQGLNLSLQDIACLQAVLSNALDDGHSIGSLSVLQRYVDQRKPKQKKIECFTGMLVDWFSSDKVFRKGLRRLGLGVLSHFPGGKQFLVERLMAL